MNITNNLRNKYLKYIIDTIQGCRDFTKLIKYLFDRPFYYSLDRDANRYEDGVAMRYRFAYEQNIDESEIAAYIDIYQCSMLEMMVALAIKIEDIVHTREDGDRTGIWFWSMVESLGLYSSHFNDDNIDILEVDRIIRKFEERDYDPNTGQGSLFYIPLKRDIEPEDLRNLEIWMQALRYINIKKL